jgi:hypothetical protein
VYDFHIRTGLFCTAYAYESEQTEVSEGLTRITLQTPKGEIYQEFTQDWRGAGEVKRLITTEEDAERVLSIPYIRPELDLEPYFRKRDELKGKAVAQVTLSDPICEIAGNMSEETIAMWTIQNRPLLKKLMDQMLERQLDVISSLLEQGVGPIYYFNGPEYALPPLMAPDDFYEFVVEYDRKLIDLIHSYSDTYVIIHSHGKVSKFLDAFGEMGMDGLNVLEPPPIGDTVLSDAKKRVGDNYCLIGNIQYDDIARGTKEKIEQMVKEAMDQGAPGGGFILSPCASPYERPLPEKASENLIHYLHMGRIHGSYG